MPSLFQSMDKDFVFHGEGRMCVTVPVLPSICRKLCVTAQKDVKGGYEHGNTSPRPFEPSKKPEIIRTSYPVIRGS